MVPEIYKSIINKLVERTFRGEVNWKRTTSESTFIVNFKEYSMAITRVIDGDGDELIKFQIINIEGKTIDDFWVDESNKIDWNDLMQLFDNARRKALKIDEAIDIISKELDSRKIVGDEKETGKIDFNKLIIKDDNECPF